MDYSTPLNYAPIVGQPANYVTPDQVKLTRDYAKALLSGSGQQPVQHWTQGVSNMVNALVGGNLAYKTAQQEKESNAVDAGAMLPTVPGATPSPSDGPSSAGQKTADGDPASAIASVESKGSGDYAALGPVTKTGDRAYGKYQVMGANIGPWTKEAVGREMTPDEFLKNKEAQDAVFNTKFPQGGNNNSDRASVWFTGKPLAQGAGRSDGYLTGSQYVDHFNKALGSGSSAMALAGPDGASTNPAVQAVSAALRGGQPGADGTVQVAAGRAPAPVTPLPKPNGEGIYIDPSLVQRRPQYTEGQLRGILASPRLSETAKMGFLQQYQQQGQPIDVPYPGGIVRVDPNNPTKQQFIPEGHWGKTELGDIKRDNFLIPNGRGGIDQAPINVPAAVGPRSDAGPVPGVQPSVAPQGGPAGAPAPVQAGGQNAPAPAETPPAAPVQVASLDPTAGIAAAAEKTVPGEPSLIPAAVAAPAANPLAKFAQATPPGATDEQLRLNGFPQSDIENYTNKKNYDNNKALEMKQSESNIAIDQHAQTQAADAAIKKYDTLSTQAQAARKQMPNLDLGLALMNDPNFHSGLLSGAKDTWARLKEVVGGDRLANAPNEAFDKIMAGTILDNMRTALGGLGQVRLAEISLLTKANANRVNTDASNRAVLEVSRRAVQSIDHLDQIGQSYASGDEVVDPVSGKVLLKANVKDGEIAPRRGLDVGYDKLARKFVLDHPSFSPEEIKKYETIFDTGRDPSAVAASAPGAVAPAATAFPAPPPAAIKDLKTNPGSAAHFDEVFGPGSAAKQLGTK